MSYKYNAYLDKFKETPFICGQDSISNNTATGFLAYGKTIQHTPRVPLNIHASLSPISRVPYRPQHAVTIERGDKTLKNGDSCGNQLKIERWKRDNVTGKYISTYHLNDDSMRIIHSPNNHLVKSTTLSNINHG